MMNQDNNPWADNSPAGFDDLDSFGDEYRPQHTIAAGLDTLEDGPYECEILSAVLDRTKKGLICRIDLRIEETVIQWPNWLNHPLGINAFCANLISLGFDAAQWGTRTNRPLSVEIPRAVGQLPGIHFRGQKSSYLDKTNVMRHVLRVSGRQAGRDATKPGISTGMSRSKLSSKPLPAAPPSEELDRNIPF